MNNNLLTTRWRLLRSEDLLLEREVRAVDRSHVAAERARDFDARDHAGLRGFGGAALERGAAKAPEAGVISCVELARAFGGEVRPIDGAHLALQEKIFGAQT